jgi:hypothetical protein
MLKAPATSFLTQNQLTVVEADLPKANWNTDLIDSTWFGQNSGKRTGWPNLLKSKGIIRKLLETFIRCQQEKPEVVNPKSSSPNELARPCL